MYVTVLQSWHNFPDKADRKRNRANSDEDEYNPAQEAKKRRKGDYEDDDEDEGDDSDYEVGSAAAPKVRMDFHCTSPKSVGAEMMEMFSVTHYPCII